MKRDFNSADLHPINHSILGTIYVPKMSQFELEDYLILAPAHAYKYANDRLSPAKEQYEALSVSEGFYEKTVGGVTKQGEYSEKSEAWRGMKPPQNLYEQLVYRKAHLTYTQLTLTMFLCDKEGNLLCRTNENFGEMSNERLILAGNFLKDEAAVALCFPIITGVEPISTNEVLIDDKSAKKQKK